MFLKKPTLKYSSYHISAGKKSSSSFAQIDKAIAKATGRKPMTGVSVFDPALCELIYNWYVPKNGEILDPFCGGSVRGIVSNYLGYKYTGIDIRQEQIDSNREQSLEICKITNQPNYYVGDSNKVLTGFTKKFDFIFSIIINTMIIHTIIRINIIFRKFMKIFILV